MDSSGAPLFKRGYRKEQTTAPINEVLAAGMLQLAGWDGKGNFLDPMWIGNSSYRSRNGSNGSTSADLQKRIRFYELEELRCRAIRKIKEFRVNRVKAFEGKIVGYDINEDALDVAWKNIKEAEMDDIITVKRKTSLIQKGYVPIVNGV